MGRHKKISWPKKNKPASFRELVKCLRHAFLQGASWTRINEDADIKWAGPGQETLTGATSLEYEEWLMAENLRYSQDDQGRDFLDEIFGIALQLGMEQGRRVQARRDEPKRDLVRLIVKSLNEAARE